MCRAAWCPQREGDFEAVEVVGLCVDSHRRACGRAARGVCAHLITTTLRAASACLSSDRVPKTTEQQIAVGLNVLHVGIFGGVAVFFVETAKY